MIYNDLLQWELYYVIHNDLLLYYNVSNILWFTMDYYSITYNVSWLLCDSQWFIIMWAVLQRDLYNYLLLWYYNIEYYFQ